MGGYSFSQKGGQKDLVAKEVPKVSQIVTKRSQGAPKGSQGVKKHSSP